MKRFNIIFKGFVQGVGFRFFAQTAAEKRRLTGWAKNEYDGSVNIEIQGRYEDIISFIDFMKCGVRFAEVDDTYITEIPVVNGEKSFRIKY